MDKLTKLWILGAALCSINSVSAQAGTKIQLDDARDNLAAIDHYIAVKKTFFAIKGQKTDIFGRSQDPGKALVEKRKKAVVVEKPKVVIALQDVVDALPVTLIDPRGNRVVLEGHAPMSVGEIIELDYKGESVVLRFEGSRSNGAYFRNLKNQELKLRSISRLGKGIQQGNQRTTPAGVHKVDFNKPKRTKVELNLAGNSRN